ncbi:MAG: bifunctional phosphopantothenoylcysteine decarboxylase/phosphopantothenate--cysteine ligase CoaBC [Gammaproteobacteria bacterium WSBS_2016_MAG_OTU1]
MSKTTKTIALGVCGSVAAYKAAILTRLLTPHFAVQALMTSTAQEFIGAATLRALSGRAVAVDEWRAPLTDNGMDHIALMRAADGLLIAPASADFLAKAAAGMADSLLLSAFLAADCPRWVAPAMNQQMWHAAATQRNVQKLAADGVVILSPAVGEQACGEIGLGRMMEPADIVEHLQLRFSSALAGRRVVVSTGATVEHIDDMRVISNISSGEMGFCIALAAHQAGADVIILAAQTTASPPPLPLRRVLSSKDMLAAAMEECGKADMFISVAAVADFAPLSVKGKISREQTKQTPQKSGMTLSLSPTQDILATVIKHYPKLFTVGFAAETGTKTARIKAARAKMRRKNTSMLAENSIADAGDSHSELTVLTPGGEISLPRQTKAAAAAELVSLAATEFVSRETLKEAQ